MSRKVKQIKFKVEYDSIFIERVTEHTFKVSLYHKEKELYVFPEIILAVGSSITIDGLKSQFELILGD